MIGIIGGSGLYRFDGLDGAAWRTVETPWGPPSDQILTGTVAGHPVAFLPRHGRGHRLAPSDLNFRANVAALKQLGVTRVLSLSAVGSLREDLAPGTFVVVDQFVDRTRTRASSFFGEGLVAHVSLADPVCRRMGDALEESARSLAIPAVRGGCYLAIEGPQFSTRAESMLYRDWGMSVIGMTNMPEAKLAREAELCYATVAMVTDYDCWHGEHADVTVSQVVAVLRDNADRARRLVLDAVPRLAALRGPCPAGCDRALDHALITAPEARDPEMVSRLAGIAGRVL